MKKLTVAETILALSHDVTREFVLIDSQNAPESPEIDLGEDFLPE